MLDYDEISQKIIRFAARLFDTPEYTHIFL